MPTARVIENPAMLYAEPNVNTPIMQLPVGNKMEVGAVRKAGGAQWVTVALPDGRKGFVPGTTRVFTEKPVILLQDGVDVYASPSAESGVMLRFPKNARFDLIDRVDASGGTWVKVRDAAGHEGFIGGQTRIQNVVTEAPASRDSGLRSMGIGLLLCLAGILITVVTYNMASDGGGTYFIMWGPMVFGAWRFLKGLVQCVSGE